MGWSSGEGLRF